MTSLTRYLDSVISEWTVFVTKKKELEAKSVPFMKYKYPESYVQEIMDYIVYVKGHWSSAEVSDEKTAVLKKITEIEGLYQALTGAASGSPTDLPDLRCPPPQNLLVPKKGMNRRIHYQLVYPHVWNWLQTLKAGKFIDDKKGDPKNVYALDEKNGFGPTAGYDTLPLAKSKTTVALLSSSETAAYMNNVMEHMVYTMDYGDDIQLITYSDENLTSWVDEKTYRTMEEWKKEVLLQLICGIKTAKSSTKPLFVYMNTSHLMNHMTDAAFYHRFEWYIGVCASLSKQQGVPIVILSVLDHPRSLVGIGRQMKSNFSYPWNELAVPGLIPMHHEQYNLNFYHEFVDFPDESGRLILLMEYIRRYSWKLFTNTGVEAASSWMTEFSKADQKFELQDWRAQLKTPDTNADAKSIWNQFAIMTGPIQDWKEVKRVIQTQVPVSSSWEDDKWTELQEYHTKRMALETINSASVGSVSSMSSSSVSSAIGSWASQRICPFGMSGNEIETLLMHTVVPQIIVKRSTIQTILKDQYKLADDQHADFMKTLRSRPADWKAFIENVDTIVSNKIKTGLEKMGSQNLTLTDLQHVETTLKEHMQQFSIRRMDVWNLLVTVRYNVHNWIYAVCNYLGFNMSRGEINWM